MAAIGRPYSPVCVFILLENIILYIKFNYKKVPVQERKKNEQEVVMLLQKRTDTRGVGTSNMRKYIQLHPLATPIHSTHSPQLSSILLTFHKFKVWMTIVESGWNVWVWLVGVVSRRWVWLVGAGLGGGGCG